MTTIRSTAMTSNRLFIVIDHTIDEIHHGFRHFEDFDGALHPVGLSKEIIVNTSPATIVFLTQVAQVGIVAWKSHRTCFQMRHTKPLRILPSSRIGRTKEM